VSLADRGLKPFGALKGESGKASHLRGFSLVGAPGLNRGPSSPPGCFNRWREVLVAWAPGAWNYSEAWKYPPKPREGDASWAALELRR
jgi:hypothetical protein